MILAPRFLASAFASGPALLILLALILRTFTRFDAGKMAIQKLATIVSVETRSARRPSHYKRLLVDFPNLAHVTVEVNAHSPTSSAPD